MRYALYRLLPLLLVLLAGSALARSSVWVVLSKDGGVYAESAGFFQSEMRSAGLSDIDITVGTWASLRDKTAPDLVVTIGLGAFEAAATNTAPAGPLPAMTPLIASLLPSASYRSGEGKLRGRPMTAVFLDPPPGRFFDFLAKALPGVKRVGVLVGPVTDSLLPDLRRVAEQRAMTLVAVTVGGSQAEIYPALKTVLESSEVLLAFPEPLVYSVETLPKLLMASYRARVPMVGFAPGYVTAGAVGAVYVTPGQVMRETVRKIAAWARRSDWGPARAPREISVSTNPRVAESLGLSLAPADVLLRALESAGGNQ